MKHNQHSSLIIHFHALADDLKKQDARGGSGIERFTGPGHGYGDQAVGQVVRLCTGAFSLAADHQRQRTGEIELPAGGAQAGIRPGKPGRPV